jgi:hypothetical protein
MWKVPSIEEIYNEFHKQTFFMRNGVYPKTIQNFKSLYDDPRKVEHIKFFIEFLKRNRASVDWKLYILSLAKVLKTRYDLKYLGSFAGNKVYRDYVKSLYITKDDPEEIYTNIINSLTFLNTYLKENELTFDEYFNLDSDIIPVALKHVYAGTMSLYFYACFPQHVLSKWFNYNDDVFQELFKLSKYEFLDSYIISKRNILLTTVKTQHLISKLEEKFNKYF